MKNAEPVSLKTAVGLTTENAKTPARRSRNPTINRKERRDRKDFWTSFLHCNPSESSRGAKISPRVWARGHPNPKRWQNQNRCGQVGRAPMVLRLRGLGFSAFFAVRKIFSEMIELSVLQSSTAEPRLNNHGLHGSHGWKRFLRRIFLSVESVESVVVSVSA
jgi:hypothetical protein